MASAQYGRETISIIGSSTVYPFARIVAETFARETAYPTPTIEPTGSGGGFRLFCAGIGVEHPDLCNASRRIRADEFAICEQNGVGPIVEIKIGYDGVVMANNRQAPAFHLTRGEIFLALAKAVPDPAGTRSIVANPYPTWRAIDPRLPDLPIRVLGPSTTSGTRDAFMQLAMEAGADQIGGHAASRPSAGRLDAARGRSLRTDGAYVEEGEDDPLIVHKLINHPDALGIFGFGMLVQNADHIKGASIDGVMPTAAGIAAGRYPLSRPLYIYVKSAHVDRIPGIREFLTLFTSEAMWGPNGALPAQGLVPMAATERERQREIARRLTPLDLH